MDISFFSLLWNILPLFYFIILICILLFGGSAILKKQEITKRNKIIWYLIIILLNFIGLIFCYLYFQDKKNGYPLNNR